MITGLGVDVLTLSAVRDSLRRVGEALPRQVLGEQEMQVFLDLRDTAGEDLAAAYLARRICAKESYFKASGSRLGWRQVQVLNDERGRPYIEGAAGCLVSISDHGDVVTSAVVLQSA